MPEQQFLSQLYQYSPALFIAVWILLLAGRKLWPVILKAVPSWAARQRAADERKGKQEEAERQERLRREDQLVRVIQTSTEVNAHLSASMDQNTALLKEMLVFAQNINMDMEGVYVLLQQPRPSRTRERVVQSNGGGN